MQVVWRFSAFAHEQPDPAVWDRLSALTRRFDTGVPVMRLGVVGSARDRDALAAELAQVPGAVFTFAPETTYDDADHVLAGLHSEELISEGSDPEIYGRDADPDYLADTRAALERRMPDLPLGDVERAWAGLYPVSPDGLPIVGPARSDPSVILAVGGGGSGIQMSPIMGALAADWIAQGEPRSLSGGLRVSADRQAIDRSLHMVKGSVP